MFTGIISELGKVKNILKDGKNTVFAISASKSCKGLKIGDSIAVNGACHTVVKKTAKTFSVESMPETLKRTNLVLLKIGDGVNLEKPVKVSDSLDGHIVTGHIDGLAKITKIKPVKNSVIFEFQLQRGLSKFIVEKGSIALDGISLTVISIQKNKLTVGIIPHTIKVTNLKEKKVGDLVNVETDILAKHVAKLLGKN